MMGGRGGDKMLNLKEEGVKEEGRVGSFLKPKTSNGILFL